MELWIRSQDRLRLCKANNLFIKNLSICCSCNDENNDYDYLGVYSTKERALQVLDEIQSKIKPQILVKSIGQPDQPPQYRFEEQNKEIIIYEMPKE